MSGAEAFALALVIIAFLAGPIGTAIGRRIGGKSRGGLSENEAGRIAELEQRLQELETIQGRVTELEERVDFAERMLAHPAPDAEKALPSRSAHG